MPGADERPSPPPGFTVMFLAYLFRGLSLPAHEFLRCLLFSYGIQLWQLTPNAILHLAIFVTVCESFLGIEPHFGLWKKVSSSSVMGTIRARLLSVVSGSPSGPKSNGLNFR